MSTAHCPSFLRASGLLLAGILTLACADAPEGVAERFWRAVAAGDVEEAVGLSSTPSAHRIERLAARKPLTAIEVGTPVVAGDRAEVETRLVRGAVSLVFPTTLERIDGEWRVDDAESTQAFHQAVLEASMAGLNDVLQEGAGVISDVVEDGLEQATEAMREALEQLERDTRQPR